MSQQQLRTTKRSNKEAATRKVNQPTESNTTEIRIG